MNMSWKRAKTPGWAAFDPNKQQKQVNNDEIHNDPYPPISTNIPTSHQSQNHSRNLDLNGRSFSSVLTHSSSLPDMISNDIQNVPSGLMENNHNLRVIVESKENNISHVYEKLKELHPWADEKLIEDIVAAVDNDIDKASSLLKEMTSPGSLQEKKEEENIEEHGLSGKVVVDDNVALRLIIDSLSMIPVEPEWEDDDDVYIMHRKEAIKAMRSASRYSKAAKEAYLRKDHATAHEFSLKAREEWSASEKLNAKAANEILAIRNSENDDWKLDLHGLHASEAVQVLQQHLLKIESHLSTNPKQQLSKRRLLEVITGKGSHSRGQAALPIAIKSFLTEKGYYSYEARIGVITVQPKFRQLSTILSST
ncbi:uncharacterized protein LOC111886307 [Lactuca sativa]|uniref:Smr domain-containing protein n=1 Tax=Lactuca sativa TaxID=4236 RepID=A0A9R1WAA8_LACSA|nr:uncharacterized protein LOC111886307 [Lactuca sativa]KAJ0220113.1 hypothetical protein LSAT_V11C200064290 [Lactuca sativa]